MTAPRTLRSQLALRPSAASKHERRGVALLMALIMVVLMTAFVTEFNFGARTKILGAMHTRDDARAEYLAKSGVRMYGLLLSFGSQAAGNQMVQGFLQQLGINLDGAAMVCKNIPFLDTAMLRFLKEMGGGMMSDEDEEDLLGIVGLGGNKNAADRGAVDETADEESDDLHLRRGWLDFEGDFKVNCTDESSKIDVNGFYESKWMAKPLERHPVGLMLYGLMASERYDPLFEERLKIDRWELIADIKDFIDPDETRSGRFSGDEEALYADFEPRYKPRNAKLDTVEDLQLVASVTDEVWNTFGPSLSVHTQSYKINIMTAPAHVLAAATYAMVDPAYANPLVIQAKAQLFTILRIWIPYKRGEDFIKFMERPWTGEFGTLGQLDGIVMNPELRQAVAGMLGATSKVFRLSSVGYIGDSERTVEATLRVRRSRLVYLDWKEY